MLQIKCYVFLKCCQEPRDQVLKKEEPTDLGRTRFCSVDPFVPFSRAMPRGLTPNGCTFLRAGSASALAGNLLAQEACLSKCFRHSQQVAPFAHTVAPVLPAATPAQTLAAEGA